MAKRHVLVELAHTKDLAESAFAARADPGATLDKVPLPKIAGVNFDEGFPATFLVGLRPREQSLSALDTGPLLEVVAEPKASTYIVRAECDEAKIDNLADAKGVVGVFADVGIAPTQPMICPGSPPLGTDSDVERLLCAPAMRDVGMDGTGVLVAIVDTGVNVAYLNSRGKTPTFDAARSWAWAGGLTPGSMPVDHGTMCAFDVCIAAPRCTLLDIALLHSLSGSPLVAGLLSDAVRAFSHLTAIMLAPRRAGELRSMVVNNSWGMFHPSWDLPVGHPGNYSDNPDHPFNRAVAALERAGADILFAAGNCGSDCPDGRCQGITANAIYGANSHPAVLTVAGVDTLKRRVGYSTQGPGRLTRMKPDLAGFTHFRGSGVYPADGGTSAATPVVAGVVAALRSKLPFDPSTPGSAPAAIRTLMTATAEDLGPAGFDFDHGFGVVGGCALHTRFRPAVPEVPWLCRRYPWLCSGGRVRPDICMRFPQLCTDTLRRPSLSGAGHDLLPTPVSAPDMQEAGATEADLVQIAYEVGYADARAWAPQPGVDDRPARGGGCGCVKGGGSDGPSSA